MGLSVGNTGHILGIALLALACGFLLFSTRARAPAGGPRRPARAAAAFSLAAWLAVLTLGRLIGYF